MTANYPASILPPNATAVERAIDRASAAALERLPVYLIRWVKDPDSCPLALLPWLAWEYQVDTWNINWSEQKKRDAIKRAHYIHRHRGTVAAVRHALVDSPFGTDIVEWFNQNPKGDPYTFRLNVYQNDLPVTEYDQQDLKLAVLRARNLRSWFSVHVFGRLQGTSYAAGYMYATEKITPRFVPLQVVLSRYELNLAPEDEETVTVTILPEYAEDKTFTVTTSDQTIATVRIVNGDILVTGMKRGTCSVTVTTTNGVSAVISIKVVAVMKFITRIDSATRPIFFAHMDEGFTVDYGDGIDSRDYRFDPASEASGWVIPTRELVQGKEYTITVKNTETACLRSRLSNYSSKLNPVVELISV
ncbi:phage tail protein I, partial [Klebsiella pneumoniae]|nr:phage tail protein I [Klebsiella pneumoniae]